MDPVKLKELPVGRVGRVIFNDNPQRSKDYCYIAHISPTQYLQIWQGYSYDSGDKIVDKPILNAMIKPDTDPWLISTDVEIMPIDTKLTICFNGEWGEY